MAKYIFSVYSERTRLMAESIVGEKEIIYVSGDQDILGVIRDCIDSEETNVILMDVNEDENLNNAIRINDQFRYMSTLKIYCCAISTLSEHIIDHMNEENRKVHLKPAVIRRIYPARSEVLDFLANHSLLKEACTIRGEKWINIAVIGLGVYGMEFFRHVLWCAQDRKSVV